MRGLWKVPILAALAVALLACGGDDDGGGGAIRDAGVLQAIAALPSCNDWTTHPVTAETMSKGCRGDDGIMLSLVWDCQDGRKLYANDYGWGYFGQPMTRYADGAEKTVPSDEFWQRCHGS